MALGKNLTLGFPFERTKMKRIFVAAVLFFSVNLMPPFAHERVQLPEKEKFLLVLLAGQSNMAGRGFIEAEDKIPHRRVLVMNQEGNWVPSVEPTHFDKPSAGTCLGRTFALALAESDPSVTVGIIPAACGGSSIVHWQPGVYYPPVKGHPYDDALARTKKAQEAGTLVAILWHQGEADCNEKNAPEYYDRLLALIRSFRRELNALNVPVLIGGLNPTDNPYYQTVTDAQKRVVAQSAPAAFIEPVNLTLNPDGIHFDRQSLIKFGKDYFAQFERLK